MELLQPSTESVHSLRLRRSVRWLVVIGIFGWGLSHAARVTAQNAAPEPAKPGVAADEPPFPKRVPAPPLDGGLEWINATRPIKLADLRGKFVLVDFWTFCCINCMHVLPELKQLEHAYPNDLVVVGVHSAKFAGEQEADNIREAVLRYEIEHPVVNDAEHKIWDAYGIQSWPTLVLIDPAGEAVWVGSGEHKFEDLKALLERGLPYYRKHGLLDPAPLTVVKKPKPPTTPLRFPGKVLADEKGKRLFIADSNHNRVVVTNLDGKLQFVVGSGEAGHTDGDFEKASFRHPQGMALAGNDLYVADTENHLLRKVDLKDRQVTTVAGTGEEGSVWPGYDAKEIEKPPTIPPAPARRFVGPPKTTAINSPWALWVHGGELFIAMAGDHQIWKMSLDGREIGPYAGNGREDDVEGPLLSPKPFAVGFASFAQPSGLTSDGKRLFVADSEGSAIRVVPLEAIGRVQTLFGTPGSLFDFGDIDGVDGVVRLQHPLGVAWYQGKLYIADTYNNKIKVADLKERSCRTFAGTGMIGDDDFANGLEATFNEPAGLTAADGKLFVADTNNHVIRVIELAPPHRVTTLDIGGLSPPTPPAP